MKTNLFVLALTAFLVDAFGDGWVLNPSGNTLGDRPTRSVATASVVNGDDGLPVSLPLGVQAMRDHVVSKDNGLGIKAFIVALGFDLDGEWKEAKVVKTTHGYDSFADALVDIAEGAQIALDMLNSPGSIYPEGLDLYATLQVWSLLDQPNPGVNTINLSIGKKIGNSRSQVTVQKMVDIFSDLNSFDPEREVEQVIIPVPDLTHIHIEMERGGAVSTLDWWASLGQVQLSSDWPTWPAEKMASGYLSINNREVSSGKYTVRITLEKRGAKAVYTQFGERLTPPSLKLLNPRQLEIKGFAKGSHVEILASQDNRHWELFTVHSNATSVVYLPFTGPDQKILFFRAVAR